MSFGKLYGFNSNARTTVLQAIAKEHKLDIEFVETNPANELSAEYKKLNPLGRVPTFEAPNGWILSEVIAIAIYCKYANVLLPRIMMSNVIISVIPGIITLLTISNSDPHQHLLFTKIL